MTSQSISTRIEPDDSKFHTDQILSIVGGHFTHDTYTAFVSPLLPLLMQKMSLSLTAAGSLAAFIQLPALLNPFIGYFADRLSLRYFVIFAPAVTATLISSMGFAPNYWTLALLLFVTGISVAAFHAPAPAMVARISGKQVGRGMSYFMAGGELGRTVGPLVAVWAVSTWTLDGFYRVVIFGWAATVILFWRLHGISAKSAEKPRGFREALPAIRRLFIPMIGIRLPREFMMTALSVYLPTFMTQQGASLWIAGAALSVWEVAGVVGALTGGHLSDRIGRKQILLAGIAGTSLMMLVFLRVEGWLLTPILLLLGFTGLSTSPVLLAVVQDNMPENRALGNGIFIAISFLVRPIAIFSNGLIGDHFGLHTTYFISALIALLAIPAILWLPTGKVSDKT